VKDDYVIVLDFLARGHSHSRKSEPIAQAVGDKFLNLLDVVLKDDVEVKSGDRLYIGEKEREKVKYIKGRLKYDELTGYAKKELEYILEKIIENNEGRFVEFFNKAKPVSTRLHSLELLPGIGKKHMWAIIRGRRRKEFENFNELKERIEMLPDPTRMIKKRIIDELKEKDRHKLFVR
jgi:putative nucleotide binding protein